MKKMIFLAIGFTALAGSAFAQGTNAVYVFKDVDIDGDNYVSMSEAQARAPDITLGQYMNADSDKDGRLNQDEFAVALKAYTEAHAAK